MANIKTLLVISILLFVNMNGSNAVETNYTTGLNSENNEFSELNVNLDEDCLVPCDEIVSGGPGKDGIPSIDNPQFVTVQKADDMLDDTSVVIGVKINGKARAYPYDILNWHEIVNDQFQGIHNSVTYCPLTGTGILYKIDSVADTTLGVSGKLYENNLVMYDRDTDTYYSQMKGIGIMGERLGVTIERGLTIETTWGAWKAMFPDSDVLSQDTGFTRDYDLYPYGSYYTDESVYFKSSFSKYETLSEFYTKKTLTVVLEIASKVNLISFNELALDSSFEIEDQAVIFFQENARMAMVFDPNLNGNTLSFTTLEPTEGSFGLNAFQDDQTGSIWNILGESIEGPNKGEQLNQLISYNAFWFAAVSFFPDASVHFVGSEPYSNPPIDDTTSKEENASLFFLPAIFGPVLIVLKKRKRNVE